LLTNQQKVDWLGKCDKKNWMHYLCC
jgi:hypothetical protein